MSKYIKLETAPLLSISHPGCGACSVEVESDGDGFLCPVCGTCWSYSDGEDDPGTLYEEWSGEELDGDAIPADEAWKHGSEYTTEQRRELMARIMKVKS